ncbi:hypothetical protein ACXGQW_03135 [Wenyingzhuangia sp. IMCC45533]
MDKGLVQKVLNLYFKYCELDLPFKIGDEYEIHEFDLEYLHGRIQTKYDTYQYAKELNFSINDFKMDSATLIFCWDELTEFEFSFIKPIERIGSKKSDEILQEVFAVESLFIIETTKQIKLKYVVGLEGLEFTIYK